MVYSSDAAQQVAQVMAVAGLQGVYPAGVELIDWLVTTTRPTTVLRLPEAAGASASCDTASSIPAASQRLH